MLTPLQTFFDATSASDFPRTIGPRMEICEQARPVNRWPMGSFDEHKYDVSPFRHRACWQNSRPSAFASDAFDPPAAPASDT